jgi:hypothetical protein
MHRVLSRIACVCAGLLSTCLGAGPAAAAVVVSFSGTVSDVSAFGATPPAGVSIGDPVSGTVSYVAAGAQGEETGPSDWSYAFNPGGQNFMTVTIGAQTWTTSLAFVQVCDGECSGDELGFGGVTASSTGFPGFLDNGLMTLQYFDSSDPFDVVAGTDLPDATQDVDFSAVDGTLGTIGSTSGTGLWVISFTTEDTTLPVRSMTWSQMKRMFATP